MVETVKNLVHAGGPGSTPGLERSPREGNGHPLQYSCLENSTVRGGWRATVRRIPRSEEPGGLQSLGSQGRTGPSDSQWIALTWLPRPPVSVTFLPAPYSDYGDYGELSGFVKWAIFSLKVFIHMVSYPRILLALFLLSWGLVLTCSSDYSVFITSFWGCPCLPGT